MYRDTIQNLKSLAIVFSAQLDMHDGDLHAVSRLSFKMRTEDKSVPYMSITDMTKGGKVTRIEVSPIKCQKELNGLFRIVADGSKGLSKYAFYGDELGIHFEERCIINGKMYTTSLI